MCVYVFVYGCMGIHKYVYICVYMCACVYVYVFLNIQIY